jgi:hypothetical protein
MKQAKEWFIDVIFDMWQGYICSVVYKFEIFNWYMTGFVYLHKTKEAHEHVEALNYLASALKLSKEEQVNYKLISDSKAVIINAWRTHFSNMPQERYSLHFLKNIHDKLWYHLLHRPTKDQVKKVLFIFNGSIVKYGLLDLPANKVKENEDKILHSV